MSHGTEHHLEEAEHAQHAAHNPFDKRVAMTMAMVAAALACVTLLSHRAHGEFLSKKTEESDQWSYFQSKSIKEAQLKSKMELLDALGRRAADADKTKVAEYAQDKEQIQKRAEELAKESKHYLHTHHILARSVTMFQIAIAVGAISVLTRRRAFWLVSLAFGTAGVVILAQSFASISTR